MRHNRHAGLGTLFQRITDRTSTRLIHDTGLKPVQTSRWRIGRDDVGRKTLELRSKSARESLPLPVSPGFAAEGAQLDRGSPRAA